jgi:large repetitive protein
MDSGPHAYWRLDDAAGSGMAADSVLANEGADNAPYSGVTLGQDQGPLAGSAATAGTFNGSSSYVTLQQGLVSGAANQTGSAGIWACAAKRSPALTWR